jgi:hypothetical protein
MEGISIQHENKDQANPLNSLRSVEKLQQQ